MSDLLIGTSGYDYPEWKGIFYPQDLKRKDFLSYYATQFNALELNNTFYICRADMLQLRCAVFLSVLSRIQAQLIF